MGLTASSGHKIGHGNEYEVLVMQPVIHKVIAVCPKTAVAVAKAGMAINKQVGQNPVQPFIHSVRLVGAHNANP